MNRQPTRAAASSFLAAVLLAFPASGCVGRERRPEPARDSGRWTLEEIDRHAGEHVQIEGRLDHRQGTYGFVVTDAGARIGLPNFDERMAWVPWFDYVGHRVRVDGVLIAPTDRDHPTGIPGFTGPTLRIEGFEALD